MFSFLHTEPRDPGSELTIEPLLSSDLPSLRHCETDWRLNVIFRGAQETPSKTTLPAYDPACYLCPGNKRAQGDTNPKYKNTFVFVNDYSAVKEEQAHYEPQAQGGSKL